MTDIEKLKEDRVRTERDEWKDACRRAGVCMSCATSSRDPMGCTDCLNTGRDGGAPIEAQEAIARAVIRRTLEWAAGEATKFLVGDPKNGVPLRNPMPHEIAERLRSLASMENTRADT